MRDEPTAIYGLSFKKIALIFLGIFVAATLISLFWQNLRLKQLAQKTKAGLIIIPTPTYTASPSANTKVAYVLPEYEVLSGATTKGGLPITDETPTPTPTQKIIQVPQTKPKSAPVIKTISVSPYLTKVYFDSQFPYRISFNDSWVFRRTYGTNTAGKLPQILSKVDFSKDRTDKPTAYVSAEVLSAQGMTNLENWLKKYDNRFNFSQGQKFTFRGLPAVKFTVNDGNQTQWLYFLKGAYAYRLNAWQLGSLNTETLAIRDSFNPN